jgi:stringent starvation protein B
LHVNASFAGVVCPDFIREQWKERLIIDLDPSYPLELTFEAELLTADLSFGGYVTRCSFPYGAVYVVADRSTGRGIVLDQNMPESVKRNRGDKAAGDASDAKAPMLRSVAGVPNEETLASPDGPATDEAQVAERRAAFKVIDGGD